MLSPVSVRAVALAAVALACASHATEARLSVVGGGESVVFTGTGFGETQEIRTPVVSGFESFTVSFWHKVVTPRSSLAGADSGIPGNLWSYWAVSDGPSLGSGWATKRANNQDVFTSTPVFSLYAYSWERYVRHNGHALSPGQIPDVTATSASWKHYVFSYDGARREIVKYENASGCHRGGDCQGKVENSTQSAADAAYLRGLKDSKVPKGMFRFGQSDPLEPTLTMELDDICIFNKPVSLAEAADIESFGCDSVSGLALNYNFNQRRTQSPDLFDTVSGTYNGVSRSYVGRDSAAVPECAADRQNIAACEDALVPLPYQGVFSRQLMLDFGADIGPVTSNQGSSSTASSTSAKLNVIRAASLDSAHQVSITAQCKGSCKRFTIASLPSGGVLCFVAPTAQGQSCTGADLLALNTVVPLKDGATNALEHVVRNAVPIYYYPSAASVADARDSFVMVADTDGTDADTAELTVQIITNTPPVAMDSNVTMPEGAVQRVYLPTESEFLGEPDGKRETVRAVVVRVEYDHLASNPPQLLLRVCNEYLGGCDSTSVMTPQDGRTLNVSMPHHSVALEPEYVPTYLRDVYLQHVPGSGTGDSLATIVYRLDDGMELGPEAKLVVSITNDNNPPVVESDTTLTVMEDQAGGVALRLGSLTTDREGDIALWRVTQLPQHGRVFQVTANDTKGEEVLIESASGEVQQWTDGSLNPTATSEWPEWGPDNIDGPPVLFPKSGDIRGTYTPDTDWDRSDVILVLRVREPVFLTELSFFFTWGPGAVVQIETRPFDAANDNDVDGWQVVYQGPNEQTSYCIDKPATEPCAGVTRHRLCPKPYAASEFRVILSAASSSHYIAIDAVIALGMSVNEANIVVHPEGKLLWEPDQDFDGQDTLGFVADDCPVFQVLQMDPLDREPTQEGKVVVSVTGVNDAPKVRLHGSGTMLISVDQNSLSRLPMTVVDPDTSDKVSVTVDLLPRFGSLWVVPAADGEAEGANVNANDNGNDDTAATKVDQVGTVVQAGNELRYRAGQCEDYGIETVELRVTVRDAADEWSTQDFLMGVDCSNLPVRWSVDLPGDSAVVFGIFCGIIGLFLCAVAIYFNLSYRKHMVVRVSSYRINVAMLVGCAMIFAALLSMSLDRPASECFVDGEPYGLLDADQNITALFTDVCPNANCFTRIWLLDCGAALTWGSLYAKTYRIKLLFMARNLRVKAYTDVDIARGVATYLVGTVAVLIGFSVYIGWPELTFESMPALLSSTANEKVTTVTATCSGGDAYTVLSYVSLCAFALLQGLSAYIAFTVRNINLKQVNDSKQIAFAIYTSFVIGLPGIVVGGMVESSDLSFVITVFAIFLATTSVVVSMTVPRMLDVYYNVEVQIGMSTSGAGSGNKSKIPTYQPSTYSPSAYSPSQAGTSEAKDFASTHIDPYI